MNTTTTTNTFNYTDWKNIEHNLEITKTKVLGLYGFQSNEWHIVCLEETTDNGKTNYKEIVRCNSRALAHSIREVVPTTENVTCDKCLKILNMAAK